MAYQLLLTSDVEGLGRKGQVVKVRPGYARNFLLPKKKGVVADAHTLRMQKKLQEERAKQAIVDRSESEELAAKLSAVSLEIVVKVDQEGHMYGSVSAQDIIEKLKSTCGIDLDKKHIALKHAIKATGVHDVPLKLKEGVTSFITVTVVPDVLPVEKAKEEKQKEEAKLQDQA